MEQILQAVDISLNPGASQDLRRQAMEFLQQVKESDDGWQVCLTLFVENPTVTEIARVYALDVVSGAVLRRYREGKDLSSLQVVQDTLMQYTRESYGPGSTKFDNAAVQNKLTQTLTYLFLAMYGSSWTGFFDEMLQLTSGSIDGATGKQRRDNFAGVVFYLRVVASIHDEVADVLVSRSPQEAQRNTLLKDQIRERDVTKLVASWHEILAEWKDKSDDIVEMCLKVIGRWASWINISLILTPDFVNFLWSLLTCAGKVKDASLDAMAELVIKKMNASDKIELIEFMKLVEMIQALLAQDPALQAKTPAFNVDLAEKVGRLINNVGSELVRGIEAAKKSGNAQADFRVTALIQGLMPSFFFCFSNEYDEVSTTVFPFTAEFLAFYRQYRKDTNSVPQEFSAMLPQLLNAIIAKMQYDETANWGDEDGLTDEAEFLDVRKRLKVLQDTVGAIDMQLLIETLHTIVNKALEKLAAIGWRELDLAMYELHVFGDLAFQNGNLFTKTDNGVAPNGDAAARLVDMMIKLMNSDVASYPHPSIQLQFMELIVRYVNVFEIHKELIPRALESFVQGCHSSHVRVRTRAWYLFQRFVKTVRTHIGDIAETIVRTVGDLLEIRAELFESTDDDMSSDDEKNHDATFDSQLYLFEAIGSLSSSTSITPERQVVFAREVMTPLFGDIEKHLALAQGGDARAVLQIHHDILALGTLARGFSDWAPGTKSSAPPPSGLVSDEFEKVAEAVLVSLETLNNSVVIREAARFAFSRMVGVLGQRLLPTLPRWIHGLLSQSSSKDEIQMFLRLLEQVIHGFKSEIFEILNTILTPLLEGLFTAMAQPVEGTDDEVKLQELRREFLNFFHVIINNDLGKVFVSDVNLPIFDQIVQAIDHFARDNKDPQTQKLAFGLMCRMCTTKQISFSGIGDLIQGFSATCWAVPTSSGFNTKDAQAKLVLGEIGGVQKAIYQRAGDDYISYMRGVYFPSIGAPAPLAEKYLTALQSMNEKDFKKFFKDFASGKISE
ncbi:armadillo-type protein [Tirmania nivea]|nr:armadillo-type protein [Tirmania nivea]